MSDIIKAYLRKCEAFLDAREDTIDTLAANSRLINFSKNRQIVGQADKSNDVYLLIDGLVRAKSFSEKGKEVSFLDIHSGGLFGEFSAIDGRPRSTAVVAIGECCVAKISPQCFRDAIRNDAEVAMALINILIVKNRSLTERIHEFGTMAVRHRIHAELLRIAEAVCDDNAQSARFRIPTHVELANRVCTHREAVTKELNYLASFQLLKVKKSIVQVEDYQRFRRVAGNFDL